MMIRIWVYDGVLASGVAGAIDVFHAANSVKLEGSDGPKLHWRVESLDGQPVRAASGQTIAVDGKIAARGHGDIILLTAPFVGDMEAFIAQRERILAISAPCKADMPMARCWLPIAPAATCSPKPAYSTGGSPRPIGTKQRISPAVIPG